MKRLLISFLLLPLLTVAQLKVGHIFSDKMVLQRDMPITIWGKAAPGSNVLLAFGAKTKTVVAKKDSSWKVSFSPQKANSKPQAISVSSGKEKIQLNNILIGDVWVCSGQSNMEWPMQREKHWKQEKLVAQQPLIRFNNPPPAGRGVFGVAYTDSLNKRLNKDDFYCWTSWRTTDSNSVKDMSAVAYYFAKRIVESEGVPIGLINLSIGGAPIETFIRKEALQSSKQFAKKAKGDWLENTHLPAWIIERGRQNVGSNIDGYKDELGLNHAYKPGFAFEAGIQPLLSFPIKGVLWYQGESNAQEMERVEEYTALSALMIEDYRRQWKQPRLPFYYVQLSSIDTLRYKGHFWPQFRDEQRKMMLLVPFSGMVVTSDIGALHDVHPTNKKDVGERLARWALYQTYKKAIVPSGPLPLQSNYANGKLTVYFQYANGLRTADGKSLRGFSLDGKNEVEATIVGDTIVIASEQKPAFVFYGWKPFADANMVNEEGLPASTFKIKVK
ncbi:MAG TPA: sialate O-acetylesterase [Flavisolibacter sp.]|nr:sialate O-acetylesterase [Flavisolibacter sp.]